MSDRESTPVATEPEPQPPAATSPNRAPSAASRVTTAMRAKFSGSRARDVAPPPSVAQFAAMNPRERMALEAKMAAEARRGAVQPMTSLAGRFGGSTRRTPHMERRDERDREKADERRRLSPNRARSVEKSAAHNEKTAKENQPPSAWAKSAVSGDRHLYQFPWRGQVPRCVPMKNDLAGPGPGAYGASTSFCAAPRTFGTPRAA